MTAAESQACQNLNLRTVLVLVLCLTAFSVVYQIPLVQIVLLAITLLLLILIRPSSRSRKQLWKRISRIGRVILVIFFFQLLFRRNGDILWQFGLIKITEVGFDYALASSLRFFLIILAAGLLMDYPFQDYLLALNAWKFPYEIAFIVSAIIHFLPVFNEVLLRKMEALKLRGISFKNISIKERLHLFKLLMLPVIASAINDIQYRAVSLELRGFRLYPQRSYLYEKKLHFRDYLVMAAALAATVSGFYYLTVIS